MNQIPQGVAETTKLSEETKGYICMTLDLIVLLRQDMKSTNKAKQTGLAGN